MDDHIREMSGSLAVANWEKKLGQKDIVSDRKRREEVLTNNIKMTNSLAKNLRREKLKALYKNDDEIYENELQLLGLTFRKDRI